MAKTNTIKIVTRNARIEAFRSNQLIGYVENDELFAIDGSGYAEQIGTVGHRSEIAGKLIEWQQKDKRGSPK